jgi:hypothetical protein
VVDSEEVISASSLIIVLGPWRSCLESKKSKEERAAIWHKDSISGEDVAKMESTSGLMSATVGEELCASALSRQSGVNENVLPVVVDGEGCLPSSRKRLSLSMRLMAEKMKAMDND